MPTLWSYYRGVVGVLLLALAACATAPKAPGSLPLPPEDTRPYCDHVISIEDRRLFCGPKTLAVDGGA